MIKICFNEKNKIIFEDLVTKFLGKKNLTKKDLIINEDGLYP